MRDEDGVPKLVADLEADLLGLAMAIAEEDPAVAARIERWAVPLAWRVTKLAARARRLAIVA